MLESWQKFKNLRMTSTLENIIRIFIVTGTIAVFKTEFKSDMCSLKEVTSKTQHSFKWKPYPDTNKALPSISPLQPFHPHVSSSIPLGNISGRTIYCCHHSRVSRILNTVLLYTGTQENEGKIMCVSSWGSYGVPLSSGARRLLR